MITTNGKGPRAARPSRRTLWIFGGTAAAVIVISAALGIALALVGVGVPTKPTPLPGLMTGTAPWGPNTADLRARLDRLGLELSPSVSLPSGFVRIKVILDGKHVRIPPGIGAEGGSVAPLYTGAPGGGVLRAPLARVSVRLALFF